MPLNPKDIRARKDALKALRAQEIPVIWETANPDPDTAPVVDAASFFHPEAVHPDDEIDENE